MNKINVNMRQSILLISMLFPFATAVDRYINGLNKILLIVMCVLLVTHTISKRTMKNTQIAFLYILAGTYLISFFTLPQAIKTNVNMAIYYPFLFFYFLFFINEKENILKDLHHIKVYIYGIVIIFTLFLTISIFLPISYISNDAGGWGNELYFASLSTSPNRIGPACMFIIVLIIFLLREGYNKILLTLMVLPHLYAAVEGGSRTYLVLIGCVALIFYYSLIKKKRYFWLSLIPIFIAAVIVISRSSMMTKISISLQYFGSTNKAEFWRRLSNSRNVIWSARLKAYGGFDIFHKIFGGGINFSTYKWHLWSHSDFVEILCSYGIVGIISYIGFMIYAIKNLLSKKCTLIIKFLSIFIWFFNAFFNFFYCYFNSVLCYPILLIILTPLVAEDYTIEENDYANKDKSNCNLKGIDNRVTFDKA